jgi:hypothetical protein
MKIEHLHLHLIFQAIFCYSVARAVRMCFPNSTLPEKFLNNFVYMEEDRLVSDGKLDRESDTESYV